MVSSVGTDETEGLGRELDVVLFLFAATLPLGPGHVDGDTCVAWGQHSNPHAAGTIDYARNSAWAPVWPRRRGEPQIVGTDTQRQAVPD